MLPLRVSASEPLCPVVEIKQHERRWPCKQEQQGIAEVASGEPREACAGQNHDYADNDVLAGLPNRIPPAEAKREPRVQPQPVHVARPYQRPWSRSDISDYPAVDALVVIEQIRVARAEAMSSPGCATWGGGGSRS